MRHGPQDLTLQQRACGALGRLADVDGADLEARTSVETKHLDGVGGHGSRGLI